MTRPVFSLWPEFLRFLGPYCIILIVLAVIPSARFTLLSCLAAAAVHSLMSWNWRYGFRPRWIWKFIGQVRRFHTLRNGGIVLYYEPELRTRWDMSALLRQFRTELDHCAVRFGSPLRGRTPVIYLFARHRDIAKILGRIYGGTALSSANAIVVANANCLLESVRHEFGHLFSSRLNLFAPPLFSEGMSVWVQGSVYGQPIDNLVRPFVNKGGLRLSSLLDYRFFFADRNRHASYLIAGSFT